MAGRVLVVQFDFAAEEESELSVRAGDKVTLLDASNAERDGWILVEARGTGAVGFIPSDYAKEAADDPAALAPPTPAAAPAPARVPEAAAPSPAPADAQPSPGTVYPSHSVSRLSSPPAGAPRAEPSPAGGVGRLSVLDPLAVARMTAPFNAAGPSPSEYGHGPSFFGTAARPGSATTGGGGGGAPPAPEEYASVFAAHEEWFKTAMTKRQEAYRSLQAEAMDIVRTVADAEGRAAGALQRLSELESIIADERAKWAARLSEDAAAPTGAYGR